MSKNLVTKQEIQAGLALLKAATPGTWIVLETDKGDGRRHVHGVGRTMAVYPYEVEHIGYEAGISAPDADAIVFLVNHAQAMLEELDVDAPAAAKHADLVARLRASAQVKREVLDDYMAALLDEAASALEKG